MRTVLLSLFCLGTLARADFDPTRWQFRRALAVAQPQQVCTVTLDRTIYASAQTTLADLRLARDGQEIPYVIETLAGSVEQEELRPQTLDQSVSPGAGLQLTLDVGAAAKHNRLRISTALTNFRTRVRIETSGDARLWAVARADGYVFDFSQGARKISVLTVEYPLSTRRYVRATFFGWTRAQSQTPGSRTAGSALRYGRPSQWRNRRAPRTRG